MGWACMPIDYTKWITTHATTADATSGVVSDGAATILWKVPNATWKANNDFGRAKFGCKDNKYVNGDPTACTSGTPKLWTPTFPGITTTVDCKIGNFNELTLPWNACPAASLGDDAAAAVHAEAASPNDWATVEIADKAGKDTDS